MNISFTAQTNFIRRRLFPVAMAALLVIPLAFAGAQEKAKKKQKNEPAAYPPALTGATTEVYKTVGDVKLNMYIFSPADHKAGDKRAAIVFFFGGGWSSGTPKQFEQHCAYLASRGMVAMTADYRVATRHQVKAVSCVEDAKSAVRWVRANAKRLGIDPDRIAAGGGSAGGHIAACTGTLKEFDAAGEDLKISSVPNAMVLFNPAIVLAPIEGFDGKKNDGSPELSSRMGVEPSKLSPAHHVKKGAPPTIIFHGKADTTVPYATAEIFTDAMKKAGNRCELMGAEGQTHGYFNYGRGDNSHFVASVRGMDGFLVSLKYLSGTGDIEEFLKSRK